MPGPHLPPDPHALCLNTIKAQRQVPGDATSGQILGSSEPLQGKARTAQSTAEARWALPVPVLDSPAGASYHDNPRPEYFPAQKKERESPLSLSLVILESSFGFLGKSLCK